MEVEDGAVHGPRSMGGQGDISFLLFEVERRRMFCPPPDFFGVDILVLMHMVFIG